MDGRCDYFQSTEWERRLAELEEQVIDFKTAVWAADQIDDSEDVLQTVVDHLGTSRRELDERTVAETVSRLPEDLFHWDAAAIEDVGDSIFAVPDACPHDPVGDSNRCVFHMDREEREDRGIGPDRVREEFLRKATQVGEETKNFTGAKFDDLDLKQQSLSAGDNYPIRIVGCEIDALNMSRAVVDQPFVLTGTSVGRAEFIDAQFEKDAELWGTRFRGEVSFKYCSFEGDAEFWNALFEGEVSFYASGFAEYAEFRDAVFGSRALFKYAEVGRDLEFWDAEFNGPVDFDSMVVDNCAEFRYCTFDAESNFESVDIDDRVEFRRARFDVDTDFTHFDVGGNTHFWGTEFRGEMYARAASFGGYLELKEGRLEGDGKSASFHDRAYFRYATVGNDAEFWGVEFHDEADFRDVEFGGTTEFHGSVFHDTADFTGSSHERIEFVEVAVHEGDVKFTDNTIPAGTVTQPADSSAYYDMSEATLGDLELRAEHDARLFDYFRFRETDFDGFPFPEYRRTLNRSWEIHRYRGDEDTAAFDELESTYLKAKNGANDVGDSKAASEFFLRELRYQRKDYFLNVREAGSLIEKAENLFKWGANWTYNLTCGYGERPFRTVGFSFIVILLFAGVYELAGVEYQSGGALSDHLVFSIQTFVALLIGGTDPTGQTEILEFLAALEAFFGAFAIALFVFSLTRSLHR